MLRSKMSLGRYGLVVDQVPYHLLVWVAWVCVGWCVNFLPEMAFAWKALHLDAIVKNVTGQVWASSRPGTVTLIGVSCLGVWVGV